MHNKLIHTAGLEKRKKHSDKFSVEVDGALESYDNAEDLAREFDIIFLKIQRLIRYSTNSNFNQKGKIEEDVNNLSRKFSNYIITKNPDKTSRDSNVSGLTSVNVNIDQCDAGTGYCLTMLAINSKLLEYTITSEQLPVKAYGELQGLHFCGTIFSTKSGLFQ